MERTYIQSALEKAGQEVKLQGWVHILRNHGKIKFLILRDKTGLIQCVITGEYPDVFAKAERLSQESVVELHGIVKEQSQAPNGVEVLVTKLNLLSLAKPELPIPVIEKGQNETDQAIRLDYRWLDLRKPEKSLIFKVSSLIEERFKEYLSGSEFIQIHSPKLMSAPSESGAEVFEVKYFDRKAYLAQSPQFYKQMAMASGFERVFEIGPVFRAEPSFTSRHVTEFTGLDFEMSFIESHQDVIKQVESTIQYIVKGILEKYGSEIDSLYGRSLPVPTLPFPQITLKEAKEKLAKLEVRSEKPGDLNSEEEIKLCEIMKEETGHEFVFVTEYPIDNRAFYHMRYEDNPTTTKGYDLLWNGLEIATGAQREHRYNKLKEQAIQKGLSPESINDYLDFFKYGCPPHGGVGLGLERIVVKSLGLGNIREAIYLPRTVHRLTP